MDNLLVLKLWVCYTESCASNLGTCRELGPFHWRGSHGWTHSRTATTGIGYQVSLCFRGLFEGSLPGVPLRGGSHSGTQSYLLAPALAMEAVKRSGLALQWGPEDLRAICGPRVAYCVYR